MYGENDKYARAFDLEMETVLVRFRASAIEFRSVMGDNFFLIFVRIETV